MANYSSLLAAVNAAITANGTGAITGPVLNTVLQQMIVSLGQGGYIFKGRAIPTTDPGSQDQNVFYIATTPGTYTNFSSIVVAAGECAILKGSGSSWSKEATGIDLVSVSQNTLTTDNKAKAINVGGTDYNITDADAQEKISQLGQYVDNPEWVRVVIDANYRILYGVKSDGKFYFGDGCPPQVQEYVQNIIDGLNLDEYEDIVNFLGDLIDGDTLANLLNAKLDKEGLDSEALGTIQAVENSEWLNVITDSDGKVLGGRKKDGTVVENCDVEYPNGIPNAIKDYVNNDGKKNIFHFSPSPDTNSYILSPFNSTYDIKLYFQIRRSEVFVAHNSCLNFVGVYLVNKETLEETLVHSCSDDIAPVSANSSYIGANHGLDDMRKCQCVGHDKTFADIGSIWSCDGNNYTIIGVEQDYIYLLGENTEQYPLFVMRTAPVGEYTHISGATHTSSFITTTSTLEQMHNQTRPSSINVIIDGKMISSGGDYVFNKLDVCEVYDIINSADTLAEIQRLVGTFNANPIFTELSNISSAIRQTATYSFYGASLWALSVTLSAMQDFRLDYFGFTQQDRVEGEHAYMYIPKALPISNGVQTIDFREIVPYDNVPNAIFITSEYWENAELPPDRCVQYSEKVGIASGYLFDYGVGGNNRKDNVTSTFFLNTTLKCYPFGITGTKVTMSAGTSKTAVVFRKYIDPNTINQNGVILSNTFEHNGKLYIYLDFNAVGTYNISIPAEYVGRKIDVFEKSSNVTLLNEVSAKEITVKISNAVPLYGYLVASIG